MCLSKFVYRYFSPNGMKKNKNMSNSSRLILAEAEKRGITWKISPGTQIITLNYQGIVRSYYHQVPNTSTALSKYACNNKLVTSNLLDESGVTVPRGFRIKPDQNEDYLKNLYETLKKPLVVKPGNGSLGDNITVGISEYSKYLDAVKHAFQFSSQKDKDVIVEEMFLGKEYRVLATPEKIIGVVNRIPANVIGNGKNTVEELVEIKNAEPIRSARDMRRSHLKIKIESETEELIVKQGYTLGSIPPNGKQVFLKKVSNISKGGDAIDFTDSIHPSVSDICLKAIQTIPGLAFAGIDFMTHDITLPQTKDSYVILEINDSPGFDIHDFPYVGKNRHAAREFLFLIFPELKK